MRRHSSPYSIPLLIGIALLLLARLARASEGPTPPPLPPAETATPAEQPREGAPAALSRVTLKDGQVLRGKVLSRDDGSTTLELASGGRLTLDSGTIENLSVEHEVTTSSNGRLWNRDPNRTRYLYAPSAMMLKQGEGYFSQKELLFSSASVGITDWLSVLGGSVVPAWAFGSSGMNFIFAIKAGFSLNDNLHLAAGAETLVIPNFSGSLGGFGFGFGTVTVGNPSYHASLSIGRPFAFTNGSQSSVGDIIVVLGGNARLSQLLALVTENWLFPTAQTNDGFPFMLNSLALRFLLDRWSIDVGVVRVPQVPVALPWVDFSYHWG